MKNTRENAEKFLINFGKGKSFVDRLEGIPDHVDLLFGYASIVNKARLQDLMNEISEWSNATFGEGQRNPAIVHHLNKEVPELIDAIEKYQKGNTIKMPYKEANKLLKDVWGEYADCMMLLLDSAQHFGLTADRLLCITKQKLKINKKRRWGSPDENGVVEHVRQAN